MSDPIIEQLATLAVVAIAIAIASEI